MHELRPEIKSAVVYPLPEIAADLGPLVFRTGTKTADTPQSTQNTSGHGTWVPVGIKDSTEEPYLSSTIAYELALAIHEGFAEIHIYGVDLNTESEYAWQKPGVEYLIGVAVGRGIKVVIPDNCALLKAPLYGRGYLSERGEYMSYEQLERRLQALLRERERRQEELAIAKGARMELSFVHDQMVPGLDHEIMDDRRKRMDQNLVAVRDKVKELSGQIDETAYWLHQTMKGQEPSEAIAQLKRFEDEQRDTEGPLTELQALQYVHSQNGVEHDPSELVAMETP